MQFKQIICSIKSPVSQALSGSRFSQAKYSAAPSIVRVSADYDFPPSSQIGASHRSHHWRQCVVSPYVAFPRVGPLPPVLALSGLSAPLVRVLAGVSMQIPKGLSSPVLSATFTAGEPLSDHRKLMQSHCWCFPVLPDQGNHCPHLAPNQPLFSGLALPLPESSRRASGSAVTDLGGLRAIWNATSSRKPDFAFREFSEHREGAHENSLNANEGLTCDSAHKGTCNTLRNTANNHILRNNP